MNQQQDEPWLWGAHEIRERWGQGAHPVGSWGGEMWPQAETSSGEGRLLHPELHQQRETMSWLQTENVHFKAEEKVVETICAETPTWTLCCCCFSTSRRLEDLEPVSKAPGRMPGQLLGTSWGPTPRQPFPSSCSSQVRSRGTMWAPCSAMRHQPHLQCPTKAQAKRLLIALFLVSEWELLNIGHPLVNKQFLVEFNTCGCFL